MNATIAALSAAALVALRKLAELSIPVADAITVEAVDELVAAGFVALVPKTVAGVDFEDPMITAAGEAACLSRGVLPRPDRVRPEDRKDWRRETACHVLLNAVEETRSELRGDFRLGAEAALLDVWVRLGYAVEDLEVELRARRGE